MTFDPNKPNLGADLLKTPTAPAKQAWQEFFGKFSTVPAAKVAQAAEVIKGIAGSWAGQWWTGSSLQAGSTAPDPQIPPDRTIQINRIGQAGMPEINFVPYAHGTNRFAHKGGALVGHPISFSVIGPTLRQGKYVNWQWLIEMSPSVDPSVSDVLRIDSSVVADEDGSAVAWAANPWGLLAPSIFSLYGILDADINGPNPRFHGGLYVAVSHGGGSGTLDDPLGVVPAQAGGLGFGHPISGTGIKASDTSGWEIFRVVGIDNDDGLVLDPAKKLASYFTASGGIDGKVVRAVVLFEPAATRLVAVPGSGPAVGREQVFAVVPPARALNSDGRLPFFMWKSATLCEQPWDPVTFSTDGSADLLVAGVDANTVGFEYANPPRLPIPKPIGSGTLYVLKSTDAMLPLSSGPGRMFLRSLGTKGVLHIGNLIHVVDTTVYADASLTAQSDPVRKAPLAALLGWFEICERCEHPDGGYLLTVRRVDEHDPAVGLPFWGNSSFFLSVGASPDALIALEVNVHEPIQNLWGVVQETAAPANDRYLRTPSTFNFDVVDSARLTNIVDPRWTERHYGKAKSVGPINGSTTTFQGSPVACSDRAVFPTAMGQTWSANPGNLNDLGFRVVLFPAKVKEVVVPDVDPLAEFAAYPPTVDELNFKTKNLLVPDWDRPIDSNEALIDPALPGERQFVEIDYANGLVRLSHAPTTTGGAFAPTGDIMAADDNPRQEMVVFACLVPYSREAGQTGTGVRVTNVQATEGLTNCDQTLMTTDSQADVYGQREWFNLRFGQIIGWPNTSVVLDGHIADRLPASGYVEVLEGTGPEAAPPAEFMIGQARGSALGYYNVVEGLDGPDPITTLHGVWGFPALIGHNFTVNGARPCVAVVRRDVVLPSDFAGNAGVPYAYDTTFGRAKRATTLRFSGAALQTNADGSVTVTPVNDPAGQLARANLGDLFSSWVLVPTTFTGGGVAPNYTVALDDPVTIVWNGYRKIVAAQTVAVGDLASPVFLYVDGTDCSVNVAAEIPLSSPEHILLAHVAWDGAAVVVTDLQYPMVDVDKRMDIYVGRTSDLVAWAGYHPCFDTLEAAIKYVNIVRNPTAGFGASSGPQTYIHVVGSTLEDGDLPIVIETDGIVVEGIPRVDGAAARIVWAKPYPLIDFNGHNDIEFRGVSFRWSGGEVDEPLPVCSVFTNGGELSQRIVVTECRLDGTVSGHAQGFMYSRGTKWIDCRFEDNFVDGVQDFGILFRSEPIEVLIMGYAVSIVPSDQIDIVVTGAALQATLTDPNGVVTVADPCVVGTPGMIVLNNAAVPDTYLDYYHDAGQPADFRIPVEQARQYTLRFEKGATGTATFTPTIPRPSGYSASVTLQSDDTGFCFADGDYMGFTGYVIPAPETARDVVIARNTFVRNVGDRDVAGGVVQGMTPMCGYVSDGVSLLQHWTLAAVVGDVTIQGTDDTVVVTEGTTAEIWLINAVVFPFPPSDPIVRVIYGGNHDVAVGYCRPPVDDHHAYILCNQIDGEFTLTGVGAPFVPASVNVYDGQSAWLGIRRPTGAGAYYLVAMGPVTGPTGCGVEIFSDFRGLGGTSTVVIGAVAINYNNAIVDNRIEGFHVGVWTNNALYSEITNNYIEDTWNTGIVEGPWSASYVVSNNILDAVFLEKDPNTGAIVHGGPFLYPGNNPTMAVNVFSGVKHGILHAGYFGTVDDNTVSTDVRLPVFSGLDAAPPTPGMLGWLTYDIWCTLGFRVKMRGNVATWALAGSGIALDLRSNWAPNCVLNAAYDSIVDGNAFTTLAMAVVAGSRVTNNLISELAVTGNNCVVSGNFMQVPDAVSGTLFAVNGTGCVVHGNRVVGVAGSLMNPGWIKVDGASGLSVVGNVCDQLTVGSIVATASSVVSDNIVQCENGAVTPQLSVVCDVSGQVRVSGNVLADVSGDLTVVGDAIGAVVGNNVPNDLTATGLGCKVDKNIVGNNLSATCLGGSVCGNSAGNDLAVTTSAGANVNGNLVGRYLDIGDSLGARCVGNGVVSAIRFDKNSGNSVIVGNQSAFCLLGGTAPDVGDNYDKFVVTGNAFTNLYFTMPTKVPAANEVFNATVTGNYLSVINRNPNLAVGVVPLGMTIVGNKIIGGGGTAWFDAALPAALDDGATTYKHGFNITDQAH